ncbi:hypothetical protein [Neolewinella agarilytica]|uniref:hypothetical protein n=1 Tax=Neolewinella agarilytica TaxID=478744 RepID=UPI002351FCF9|nr:hypothetical protein [Neolewinella agarilytica]
MAKKRFTDDLFGLFEEPTPQAEASSQEPDAAVAPSQSEEESVEVKVPTRSSRAKRKLSSKKFTADLDNFLSESFERESNNASSSSSAPASAPQKASRPRRRKTGLDLLIRSTVADEDRSTRGGNTAETKRVTLIFKKDHLTELKEQAKERGMFLKDVVQEMVSKYLEEEG